MARDPASIGIPAKSGFSTGRSSRGFWPAGIVRAGLYARVSTHDQQTLPLQLAAMREYVSKRGWKTALEIWDVGSGGPNRRSCSRLRGDESLIGSSCDGSIAGDGRS